jgi:RNA polymerase sigma-70 factor (ECF subfamily)
LWRRFTAPGRARGLRFVYQATSAKLFGVLIRILGDRSEAEDVLQEVYLTVWRRARSFDAVLAAPVWDAKGHAARTTIKNVMQSTASST